MIDFEFQVKKALICPVSIGLGYGCANALAKCTLKLRLNSIIEERFQMTSAWPD